MTNIFSIFSILALITISHAFEAARLVPQPQIHERATYNGGWALALPGADCPTSAPVSCGSHSGTVNPTCCPSGQNCFGLLAPHCCPTNTDCENVVENLPVCANSTWSLYTLSTSSRSFFCCEPGQYGVLPLSGYAGICQPIDVAVAASLIATPATPAGGAVATTVVAGGGGGGQTSTVTSTAPGGTVITFTTKAGDATATETDISEPTETAEADAGSGSTSNSSSSKSTTTKKKTKIATGALVGIAVGAVVVLLALAFALWRWRKARKSQATAGSTNTDEVYVGGAQPAPLYSAVPAPYQSPIQEYKNPISGEQRYAGSSSHLGHDYHGTQPPMQHGYSSTPPMHGHGAFAPPPVEAPQRWDGRVEMGNGR